MPSVIHGGDELTDLPEAPSATENGDTQAPYDISQHRTIVEEGEKDGCLGACTQKSFSELRPLERQKTPFCKETLGKGEFHTIFTHEEV